MTLSLGHQLLQTCGAMMILLAYVGHQFQWIEATRPAYNLLNGGGSAILAFYAVWPHAQFGFIVLEFVWAMVSVYGLLRALRRRRTTTGERG